MKKLDFLLMCEQKQRELEPHCLLMYELRRRGYSVDVATMQDAQGKFRTVYDTEVFVVPGMHYRNHPRFFMGNAVKFRKLIETPTEQIESSSNYRRLKREHFGSVTKITAWGEIPKERFVQRYQVDPKRIAICGHPAMDFCFPRFAKYFDDREEIACKYGLDPGKQWNLMIASFTTVCTERSQWVELDKHEDAGRMCNQRWWDMEQQSHKFILDWFEKLLKKKDNQIIIYRPHPGEAISPRVYELEQSNHNFRIIREGAVIQWIHAADKLYTWVSTSSVQAHFAGKPFHILRPVKIDNDLEMEIFKHCERYITDFDAFEQSVSEDTVSDQLSSEQLKQFYANEADPYTYIKLADLCESVYRDPDYTVPDDIRAEIYQCYRDVYRNYPLHTKLINFALGRPFSYHLFQRLFARNTADNFIHKRELIEIERRLKRCLG